jgi:hypothetical protein
VKPLVDGLRLARGSVVAAVLFQVIKEGNDLPRYHVDDCQISDTPLRARGNMKQLCEAVARVEERWSIGAYRGAK